MDEKKYLSMLLEIVESENRLRKLFYYLVIFVFLGLLVLYCAAHYELTTRLNAVLLMGIIAGYFLAKAETIYNFRYLINHLSADSIKTRLSKIGA